MTRSPNEDNSRKRARQLQLFNVANQQLRAEGQPELPFSESYAKHDVVLANTLEPDFEAVIGEAWPDAWTTKPNSLRFAMTQFRKNAKQILESNRKGEHSQLGEEVLIEQVLNDDFEPSTGRSGSWNIRDNGGSWVAKFLGRGLRWLKGLGWRTSQVVEATQPSFEPELPDLRCNMTSGQDTPS